MAINGSAQKVPSWVLFTNTPIPSLQKALQHITASGVLVYGQGAALSSHVFSWDDQKDAPAPEQSSSEWTTSIRAVDNAVHLRTGVMNNPPLYSAHNTTSRAWAVGTNAFTLNIARSQWGMPAGLVDARVVHRDGTTSFQGVAQLPAHTRFELKKDIAGGGWLLSTQEQHDPVFAALAPQVADYDTAGTLFVSALDRAIADATRGDTAVATLLSGGIDSGAVTTLAVRAGLAVTAYSAGSPWGDEHAEAQELADYLGIRLVRVDLSAEDLLAAVPDSMRALGTAERERVDIALTISAVMRSGVVKEDHVLTGYGNDLMLLGLPPDTTSTEVLLKDIVTEVDFARHSGEFNDFVARTWGKKMSHPYWHEDVVRTALDIHPDCKVYGGREKAFFRTAMEKYIPKAAAWRKKIGIHVGGGMQGGLDALFGGVDGKVEVYNSVFKAVNECLLADPFATIDHLAPQPK